MRRRVILLTFLLLGLVAPAAGAATTHDLRGTWSCCAPGSGGVATQSWTIETMSLSSGSFTGRGRGGSFTWPITGTANGRQVTLTTGPYDQLRSYSAVFRGTLSADGRTLRGEWDDDASPTPDGTFTATLAGAPKRDPGSTPRPPSPGTPEPGDLYVVDSSAPGGPALYRVDTGNGGKVLVHQGAPFVAPRGIGFGPDGNLYIADFDAGAIHRLTLATGAVTRFSQPTTFLHRPWDVAFSSLWSDDMLVADASLAGVARVNRETGRVLRLLNGYGLRAPRGLVTTMFGQPFVADFDSQKVHFIRYVRDGWKAGVLKQGAFAQLQDVAVGAGLSGNRVVHRFFVSDNDLTGVSGRVYTWLERDPQMDPSGSTVPEVLLAGGVLRAPTGLAISNDGTQLYVGSAGTVGGGSIVAIDLRTRVARTLASGFNTPIGLAVAAPRRPAVSVGASGRATTAGPGGVTTTITAPAQPVAVTAAVVVSGLPAAQAARSVRVRPARKVIPAGKRMKVSIRFKRALANEIRAAVADGARVRVKLTITVRGASGTRARVVRRLRID